MSFTAIPPAGGKLRGSVLSALVTELRPITAAKASSTSRTNNGTPAADPDLAVSVAANTVYDFELVAYASSAANAAGHFKYLWAFPTGAVLSAVNTGLLFAGFASGTATDLDAFAQPLDSSSPTSTWPVGLSTVTTGFRSVGRITVGSTSGSLELQWSQNSSNANASTLLAGSTLTIRKVG